MKEILLLLLILLSGLMLILVSYVLLRHFMAEEISRSILLRHREHLEDDINNYTDAYRYADDLKCYAAAILEAKYRYQEMLRCKKLVLPWPPVKEDPTLFPDDREILQIAVSARQLGRLIEQKQEEERKND